MEGNTLLDKEGRSRVAVRAIGGAYEAGPLREALGETLRPGGMGITERAKVHLGMREGNLVLDAGCGVGATVAHLRASGLKTVGLELNPVLLRQSAELFPGLTLINGDLRRIPIATSCLDAIFCECVLSLFEEKGEVLAEFNRVLKPGGGLALSDMYLNLPPSPGESALFPPESCLKKAVDIGSLNSALTYAGFKVQVHEDHSEALRHLGAFLALTGTVSYCGVEAGAKPGYCLLIAEKIREF